MMDADDPLMASLIIMEPRGESQMRNFRRFMASAGTLCAPGTSDSRLQILASLNILDDKRLTRRPQRSDTSRSQYFVGHRHQHSGMPSSQVHDREVRAEGMPIPHRPDNPLNPPPDLPAHDNYVIEAHNPTEAECLRTEDEGL